MTSNNIAEQSIDTLGNNPAQRRMWLSVIGLQVLITLVLSLLGYTVFNNILGVLLLTVILAPISKNAKLFFHDWSVYLLALSVLNLLRGTVYNLIKMFHLPHYAMYVIHLERFFSFGHIMPHYIQTKWHLIGNPLQFINLQFATFYAIHFVIFFFIGFAIWKNRYAGFANYKKAFLWCLGVGVFCYLVIPSVPPWMASEQGLIPTVKPLFISIFTTLSPTLFNTFNGDPVACMPSIHGAFAMLCALIVIHEYRWKGIWIVLYPIWLDLACMALGAHYWTDLIMGNLLAIGVYLAIYHGPRWFNKAKQAAELTPPTNLLTASRLRVISMVLALNLVIAIFNTLT